MGKTKIIHVIGTLHIGGAETVAMNYFRYINRDSFNCDYLVFGDDHGEYEEEVYKLGGRVIRIPMPSNNYKEFQRNCVKVFKEGKYDIVHAHTLLNNGFLMKAAHKADIRIRVCHSHNTRNRPNENVATLLYEQYMKFLIIKHSTNLLACGRDAGIYLFGKRRFENQGVVINNAIETSKFILNSELRNYLRDKLDLAGKFVIGNVGRLVNQKNQGQLLDIFKSILNVEPNAVLLIVGDGPLRISLLKKCESLKIDHAVRFLGSRDDVSDLLQVMDVFVLPSLFEGLPVVLIEAQAAGLNCYVSNTVSKEAQISNLINFLSLNETAEYWAGFIMNTRNYNRLNMEKRISESGYDIRTEVKKLEKVYIDALEINMKDIS